MRLTAAIALIAVMSAPLAAQTPKYFKEWCDTFTAQALVSLAANRIFAYLDISPA